MKSYLQTSKPSLSNILTRSNRIELGASDIPVSESPNLMVDRFQKIVDWLLNAHAQIRRKKLQINLYHGSHHK